jgi:hypothetical protein
MEVQLGANAWGDDDWGADDDTLAIGDATEEEFAFADASLPPLETCARIEKLAAGLVVQVLTPDGTCCSPSEVFFEVSSGRGDGAVLEETAGAAAYRIAAAATSRVKLFDARRPLAYPRLWRVLEALHLNLCEGRTVTQAGCQGLVLRCRGPAGCRVARPRTPPRPAPAISPRALDSCRSRSRAPCIFARRVCFGWLFVSCVT